MPSKPADTALRDILHHIDLAASFSAGSDRASFKLDIKTVYAAARGHFELMPMGIHWPELDEDLGIAGMLRGRPGA